MLEAHAFNGDARYLQTARGAFAYEDRLFVEDAGNWVDVSQPFGHDARSVHGSCQTAWCHGAPGIALARLHAREIDTEAADVHDTLAGVALTTTVSALRANIENPGHDTTLCHGLIGLAQIAEIGGEMRGDEDHRYAAREATLSLIDRYGDSRHWPTNTWHADQNPSLMVGLAGIGHHLLRLAEPNVPPILTLEAV